MSRIATDSANGQTCQPFGSREFEAYLSRNHFLFTGRASSAIYLVLCARRIVSAKVLVPASICYAPVYAILYSGNTPLFVDTGEDGNLTLDVVAQACQSHSDTAAIIIPHMYGNPCREFDAICQYCQQRSIVVIHDCAAAMGIRTKSPGDYTVYSFGYAKTIDVGFGGLLVSDSNLDGLAELNESLPEANDRVASDGALFSDLYRVLRSRLLHPFVQTMAASFPEHFRNLFLHRLAPQQDVVLRKRLADLTEVIAARHTKLQSYSAQLKFSRHMREYVFHDGAVPWRFNILVSPEHKRDLIQHLLERRVPVSAWYPVIATLFAVYDTFPMCSAIEQSIMNFPLDAKIDESEIARICDHVNGFWKSRTTVD